MLAAAHTAHCSLLGNYRRFQSGQTSDVFKREIISSLLLKQGICVAEIRIMGIYTPTRALGLHLWITVLLGILNKYLRRGLGICYSTHHSR